MRREQCPASRPGSRFALFLVLVSWAFVAMAGEGHPSDSRLPESLAVKVRAIQKGLSDIRGHQYREPIGARTMDEEAVRAFLIAKLAKEYPDEKLAAEQTTWLHFAFLAPGDDLKELFLGMLTDQAAGFYDPDDSRLIIVSGKAFPGLALVHELAHALADQIFDLGRLLDVSRGNDDTLLAVSAMIEGEAQALSMTYVHSPGGAGMMDEDVIEPAATPAAARGEPVKVPAMLQHSFTFPYTQGMAWASEVVRNRGQAAMDAFYREPPDSTEQIMHPEKSATPRDLPSLLPNDLMEGIDAILSEAGYATVKQNVLGEFSIRELFGGSGDPSAGTAAAGWDGDLFRVV